jgi:hypothetical protein
VGAGRLPAPGIAGMGRSGTAQLAVAEGAHRAIKADLARQQQSEHTFRLFKQVLGWTVPKIRDPAAGTGGPG